MGDAWFEIRRRGATPGEEAAAGVGLRRPARRFRARRHRRRQPGGVRRARLRPPRRRQARQARPVDDRHGPAPVDACPHLPHRRPGRPPRRRGRRRPGRRGRRHGDGAQLLREQAHRGSRRRQPADLLPGLLVRHARADGAPPRAGRTRRGGRTHRHPRLVVRPLPRLGQSLHPRAARRQGRPAVRARGRAATGLARGVGQGGRAARSHRAEHDGPGRGDAEVLRGLRRVDADTATLLGRPSVAAVASGTGRSW